MENEIDIIFWNDLRSKLKQKYPQLTNADLQWRHSSPEDLIEMIAGKLEKTTRELQQEIEMF
jgi:hypothetical protein